MSVLKSVEYKFHIYFVRVNYRFAVLFKEIAMVLPNGLKPGKTINVTNVTLLVYEAPNLSQYISQ